MKSKLSVFFLGLFWCLASFSAEGSHIRGGEITARQLNGNSFEFILTIYRDIGSGIIDLDNVIYPTRDFNNPSPKAPLFKADSFLPGKRTQVCVYKFRHTYSSPGIYICAYYKEFRNADVINMSSSNSTTFYVETLITIDPDILPYNTPILTHPAVDFANVGQKYLQNPGAYDPDNDSLSYELIPCRQFVSNQNAVVEVNDYRDPAVAASGQDSAKTGVARLSVNPRTGTVTWDVPNKAGQYNYALKITEWRTITDARGRQRTVPIGYVVRDIQVIVLDANNKKPYLIIPKDTCVVANTVLRDSIFAIDKDTLSNGRPRDRLKMGMFGGLTILNPKALQASFVTDTNQVSKAFGIFRWNVVCAHVAKEPYDVLFKVEDFPPSGASLVDLQVWRIKVVGPAPTGLKTEVRGLTSIQLSWDKYICPNIASFQIFRRIDSLDIVRDTCNPGLEEGNGWTLIKTIGKDTISFLDNNNGKGLAKGYRYCYRIVALFPEPRAGKSLVSDQSCAEIMLDIPLLMEASVLETNSGKGKVRITWTRPFFPSTVPFQYQLKRREGNAQSQARTIFTSPILNDTSFIDSNLNTLSNQYFYFIVLEYGTETKVKDSTKTASTPFLSLSPLPRSIRVNWQYEVPWNNSVFKHFIYRSTRTTPEVLYDSIQTSGNSVTYLDDGQAIGKKLDYDTVYCYRILTKGSYEIKKIRSPLLNWSQKVCAEPIDTVPPCPPVAITFSGSLPGDCFNCDSLKKYENEPLENTLSWAANAKDTCQNDIFVFNIYFSPHEEDNLKLIGTTSDTFFVHKNLTSLAGCYEVKALDQKGNESKAIAKVCRDNCVGYVLPNLISPDNDPQQLNEFFRPLCYSSRFVRKAQVSVYNRFGKKVFTETQDPEINWSPGRFNQLDVPAGIYFYHADVEFFRLRRKDEKLSLKGWIQVAK